MKKVESAVTNIVTVVPFPTAMRSSILSLDYFESVLPELQNNFPRSTRRNTKKESTQLVDSFCMSLRGTP